MTLTITAEPVPLRLDDGGTYRVGPTRVTLETVIGAFKDGYSAEQIVLQYTTLQLAHVYSVISYYLSNKAQVDTYLAKREREAVDIQRRLEANSNLVGIRQRLLDRRLAQG